MHNSNESIGGRLRSDSYPRKVLDKHEKLIEERGSNESHPFQQIFDESCFASGVLNDERFVVTLRTLTRTELTWPTSRIIGLASKSASSKGGEWNS